MSKRFAIGIIAVSFFILGVAENTYCAVPKLVAFQGKLTDSTSKAITGTRSMIFNIYNVETGGTVLWSETQDVSFDPNGMYNVYLGAVTPLNLNFNDAYWLEVSVGGETLSPRYRLATTAYSFYSFSAGTATYSQGVDWSNITNKPSSITNAYKVLASSMVSAPVMGSSGQTTFYGDGSKLTGLSAVIGMSTSTYDTNNNGIVDNSEKLDGYSYTNFISTNGGILNGTLSSSSNVYVSGSDSVADAVKIGNGTTNLFLYAASGMPTVYSTGTLLLDAGDGTGSIELLAASLFTPGNLVIGGAGYTVSFASNVAVNGKIYGDGSGLTNITGSNIANSTNTFTGQNTFTKLLTVSSDMSIMGNAVIGGTVTAHTISVTSISSGITYSNAQTRYYSIPGAIMSAALNAGDIDISTPTVFAGGHCASASPSSLTTVVPVQLPQGAQISNFLMTTYMNGGSVSISLNKISQTSYSSSTQIIHATAANTDSQMDTTSSNTASETVDNLNWFYVLVVTLTPAQNDITELYGVTIPYTVTQPLP